MNFITRYRNWLNSNLLILFAFPILILVIIYINFGTIISAFLLNNPNLCKVWQLHSHILIFSSDIRLPFNVKALGFNVTVFIYLLFWGLLLTNIYLCYNALSNNKGLKLEMVLKTILILAIYMFSIIPGLNIWLTIFGYLIIICTFSLISLYWMYKKSLNERK